MSPSRPPRDTSDLFPIQVMTSTKFKSLLEQKALPGGGKKSKVEKKTSAAAKRAAAAAAAAAKEADSKAESPKTKTRNSVPPRPKKEGPYMTCGVDWQDEFGDWLQRGRFFFFLSLSFLRVWWRLTGIDMKIREIKQYIRQLIVNSAAYSPCLGYEAVPEYYSCDQSCWPEQLCGYGYETEGLVPVKMEVEMVLKTEPVEYVHDVVYMDGVYAPLVVPPEYQEAAAVWWDGGCGYGEVYEEIPMCEGVL